MLERRRGTYAELAFWSDVWAGRYTLIESLSADVDRVAELVEKYDDLPLGTVAALRVWAWVACRRTDRPRP